MRIRIHVSYGLHLELNPGKYQLDYKGSRNFFEKSSEKSWEVGWGWYYFTVKKIMKINYKKNELPVPYVGTYKSNLLTGVFWAAWAFLADRCSSKVSWVRKPDETESSEVSEYLSSSSSSRLTTGLGCWTWQNKEFF